MLGNARCREFRSVEATGAGSTRSSGIYTVGDVSEWCSRAQPLVESNEEIPKGGCK